jgi:uncharacterized repeat protein (TIGR01451 family)
MSARQRSAGLALVLVLGGLAVALTSDLKRLWAGPKPVPGRTAQVVTPEPPVVEGAPGVRLLPGPAPTQPQATCCPVDPPIPVVSIRVRVPACAATGQELEYRICVDNHAPAPAHHVMVRNPVPANARFVRANPEPTSRDPELQWKLGTLDGCACREIVLVLAPLGPGEVKDCARVQFEHGQCVCTRITEPPPPPKPQLALRKCGPEQAVLYDSLNYELVVTNTGSTEVANILLSDSLPPGLEHASARAELTWDPFTLGPGQSRRIEYSVIAKQVGHWCNTAVVTSGNLRQEASSCVTVGEPKLTLAKTGPEVYPANRPALYKITLGNDGNVPVTNLVVTDQLPEKTRFVGASDDGRPTADNRVQWSLGTLLPGARRTLQIELQATEAGERVNKVEAQADRGINAKAEARTLFEGATGLTFYVVANDNPVEVGTPTSYSIVAINQGGNPATDVRIEATLPEQMEFKDAKGPTKFKQVERRVIFDALPTLEANGQARYQIDVTPKRAGDVRCVVEMTAKELMGKTVKREASVTIYEPKPQPKAPGAPQSRRNSPR